MASEAAESEAVHCRVLDGVPGLGGQDDLASVSCRADPSGRVHCDTYVVAVRDRRLSGVESDPDPHFVRRRSLPDRALDGDRAGDGVPRPFEDGKGLIRPDVDHMA